MITGLWGKLEWYIWHPFPHMNWSYHSTDSAEENSSCCVSSYVKSCFPHLLSFSVQPNFIYWTPSLTYQWFCWHVQRFSEHSIPEICRMDTCFSYFLVFFGGGDFFLLFILFLFFFINAFWGEQPYFYSFKLPDYLYKIWWLLCLCVCACVKLRHSLYTVIIVMCWRGNF